MSSHHHHRHRKFRPVRALVFLGLSACFIFAGATALWVATLPMPDLNSFQSRKITESTKIYDRTGSVLLFDTGTNAKLTVVPLSEISPLVAKASIAIEDSDFYNNLGIEPTSIIRAVIADLTTGGFSQGASTITQQVVKNSLLTQDKTITRKIKEWVLAVKLTRALPKDKILEAYLNETPYGGTIYGVEEASQAFFGRSAKDLTLGQAAYLAAIPQAPTYYSPYGSHRSALDARRKLVLDRMKSLGMIKAEDYKSALAEKTEFLNRDSGGIRAPHFVMMVQDYLVQRYGEDAVQNGGLRVITSLDYSMQQKAEDVVNRFAPSLSQNYNASNTAMVAIDPKTGDILTMVGSRDYFDPSIDGNFNVALAERQPGSTFKPFVYATLFKKGYTPETVLFDVQTEFSSLCNPDGTPKDPALASTTEGLKTCYMPGEYDSIFEGPLTVRQALAQSRNIPAVKALYLAGMPESLQTAHDLGITSLSDPNRYGLTLVLGGGEVKLLDLVSAYGVFANDGVRNPHRFILEVDDAKGVTLEKASLAPAQALEPEIARQISNILSDNKVRMNSLKPIAESVGRPVAIKTGTTNDYRDVWTVGYTPDLVVGAWAGNNDNRAMQHNVAGLIISPLWGAFMAQAIKDFPMDSFQPAPEPLTDDKPVLRGIWQGGVTYKIDSVSGKLATQYTPPETTQESIIPSVHTILYWLDKNNPRGPAPSDPTKDSQFANWEYGVRKWFDKWKEANPQFHEAATATPPTTLYDDIHTANTVARLIINNPHEGDAVDPNSPLNVQLQLSGPYPAKKTEVYLNGRYVLSNETNPLSVSFVPSDAGSLSASNTLSITVYDSTFNRSQASVVFKLK